MSLEDLRKRIDEIDSGIVELIAERIRVAEEIGQDKKDRNKLIVDRQRELRVMEHVRDIARAKNISVSDIDSIYRQIMDACKKIQGAAVAFHGEPGAYSEDAAVGYFGPSTLGRPFADLNGVFRAVETGEVPFGIIPIENSTEGSINLAYDLLLDSNLMVCGEVEVRVSHCLIAHPEDGLDTINKVYSHPQALAQCRAYLERMNCEVISAYDTAGSVKMIREQGLKQSAAIAGARAADIYGMKILAREIEDNPHNFTRFFILSKEDSPPTGDDKTSIVFSIKHRPGALYDSLKEFAARGVNMTKLESRPTRQKPWEYNFYLDFTGHRQDEVSRDVLQALEETSIFVKILGSYPRAR